MKVAEYFGALNLYIYVYLYCIFQIEKLEGDLKSILNNERVRNQLIIDGTKSAKEYLSYQNNGSKELIKFLEKLVS